MLPTITISDQGRSGSVHYRAADGEIAGYWEFGGGDVVAIVSMGTAEQWHRVHPWAVGQRAAILRSIADEVLRQKAPSCVAEINDPKGDILLRQVKPITPRAAPDTAWVGRLSTVKMKFGLVVLGLAVLVGAIVWFKNTVLVIDPGKGTPLGLSVRTAEHIATLIQTLEPYTPSPNRDHGKDTYRISLYLVALDGTGTKLIPLKGGLSPNAYQLAKVLGSDGRTLWFDVNGVGGVDLSTYELVAAGMEPKPGAQLQGARSTPFPLKPEAYLCAGLLTGPDTWLGLHAKEEVERVFAPGKFVRRVERQEDAKQMRRFHRGALDAPVENKYHRIRSMAPITEQEYLNAAFLRSDDSSEPLRLSDPEGALMIYTSAPGLNGTLMVARVDHEGRILWKVDTAIDRFRLEQILPGERTMAFVGTRVPVPDKVSEPLLVIVDHATGSVVTHSLWR